MAAGDQSRLHAIVFGRVQGVSFRYFVISTASPLGLTGWVRNRWDGSVDVVAEGESRVLEQFLASLRQGPPAAFVENVQVEWQPATGEFPGFHIRSTD